MRRLKLDENLPRGLKGKLSALQHDAVTVEDENLLSQPDTVVAAAANEIVNQYPQLSLDDIHAALAYAARSEKNLNARKH